VGGGSQEGGRHTEPGGKRWTHLFKPLQNGQALRRVVHALLTQTFAALCGAWLERRHRSGMRARTMFVAVSKLGRSWRSMRGDVSRQKGVRGEGRRTERARIRA